MTDKSIPTPAELRKLLSYEPTTGKLFWLPRPVEMFADGKQTAQHNANTWNTKYANTQAFTADNRNGYRVGSLNRRKIYAHRAIWALHHGEWPVAQLDHVNGVRDDNRIANLRAVTQSQNSRNAAMPATNTSGVIGVCRTRSGLKWFAQIKTNGENTYLGTFHTIEEAAAARKAAELDRGFCEGHGRQRAYS